MQVGTTKDQGLYNKPSAAVHPGSLAAGTLPQYNTIRKKYETGMILSNHGVRNTYKIVAGKPQLQIRLWILSVRQYVSGSYGVYDWLEQIFSSLHGITSQKEVRVKVSP